MAKLKRTGDLAAVFVVVLFAVRGVAVAEGITTVTLDNGMTVALKEFHAAPVVAVRMYVKTGSMYEQEYLGAGISHLFEHLLSGGTTHKRTEEESEKLVASIGGQTNAYTSTAHTCYHVTALAKHFDTALDLLSDWIMNCAFTQKEYERERGVVTREMETRQSEPPVQLHRLEYQTLFKVHPVRFPVIGYRDVFDRLTREDVIKYHQRMYVPNNMLLVAVGDFRTDETLAKIRQTFKPFKQRPIPAIVLPTEPPQTSRRTAVKELPALSRAHVHLTWRTIPLVHPDLYPLDVMSYILANGDSSRLVRILRDEKRLVHSIRSWSYTPGYDAGVFTVSVRLDPDKIDATQKAVLEEVYRLRDEPVTASELARAKKQKAADHVFGLQTVDARAANIGLDILSAHDPNFGEKYVDNIQKVTAESITAVARKYFSDDRLCVTILRPPLKKSTRPEAGVPELGPVKKVVLDNGLRLLLRRNAAVPIVSMQAYVLAGVRAETPEKNGVCRLMANLLLRGTTTRTAVQIAQAFDAMGGRIGASSGNNTFFVRAACLKEDFPTALEIFADVIRNPRFAPDEIDKMRERLVAAVRSERDQWFPEGQRFFREHFFTRSAYHLLPAGTDQSLQGITREDLAAFHGRYCAPGNMVLAVFGDIDPGAARAEVARRFGTFRGRGPLVFPSPSSEPAMTENRKIVKETRKKVAAVFVGYPGMRFTDVKDRFAMEVLDAMSSGIRLPGGWLHKNLRGRQLVYVVHAYNWVAVEPGYFGVYAACEPQNADKVAELIVKVLDRARTEELVDEEVRIAKTICLTADRLQKQTNADLAAEAALSELYGLGYDFGDRYVAGVTAVTKQDIRGVARKYLHHRLVAITKPVAKKAPAE